MKNPLKLVLIIVALSAPFLSVKAFAEDCALEVNVGDNLNFIATAMEISAAKCKTVTVNLSHNGNMAKQTMGHNWVLSTTADAQAVAQAGWGAGLDNQYLPPSDARIIAATDIIGGGESTSVTFDVSKLTVGGDYTFYCSFVGHFAVMKGKFTVSA